MHLSKLTEGSRNDLHGGSGFSNITFWHLYSSLYELHGGSRFCNTTFWHLYSSLSNLCVPRELKEPVRFSGISQLTQDSLHPSIGGSSLCPASGPT